MTSDFWIRTGIASLLYLPLAACLQINRTVDDAFTGDANTTITFAPTGAWYDQTCPDCIAKPDVRDAYKNTWKHTTYDAVNNPEQSFMSIQFEGTAIYIYCILANQVPNADTKADYTFTVDGFDLTHAPGGRFVHLPNNTTDYYYNVPVYTNTTLENKRHTVVMYPVNGPGFSPGNTLVQFDYYTFTMDDTPPPTPSSSSSRPDTTGEADTPGSTSKSRTNVGAIVGGVVGGVLLIAGVFLLVCLLRTSRRKVNGRTIEENSPGNQSMSPHSTVATSPDVQESHGSYSVIQPYVINGSQISSADNLKSRKQVLSYNRPRAAQSPRDADGQNEIQELKQEIEGLRREMTQMREGGAIPPGYSL